MGPLPPGPGGSTSPPSPPAAAPTDPVAAVRAFLDAAAARAAAWTGLEAAFAPFMRGEGGSEAGYRAACEAAGGVLRGSAPAAPAAASALKGAGLGDLAATVEALAADEAHRARVAVALHALRKAGADAERGGEAVHVHGGGCGCGGGVETDPDAGLEAARDAADRGAAVAEATVELETVAARINDGLAELRLALEEEAGLVGG